MKRDYTQFKKLYDHIPEIAKMIRKAQKESWTTDTFRRRLQNSKWFTRHAETYRKMDALRKTDPKEYARQLKERTAALKAQAAKMGSQMSSAQLKKAAEDSLFLGWSNDQVQVKLANWIQVEKGLDTLSGEAGDIEDQLKQIAADNGMKYGSSYYVNAAKSIARNNSTTDDWADKIRQDAAGVFKVWGDEIRSGSATVKDLASAYTQSFSDILEIPPEQVSLSDPKIRAAITATDTAGKPAVKPLIDFEQELRQDPRWKETKNGQQTAVELGVNLAKDWGLIK